MIQSTLEANLCAQNLAAVKLMTNLNLGQPKTMIGAAMKQELPTGNNATPISMVHNVIEDLPVGQQNCKGNSMLS
jgi:hypothetical protein